MTADTHLAQSVNVGHAVALKLKERGVPEKFLREIQHQIELVYLTAIRDAHLDLAVRYPVNAAEA